ncbi:uncharacterized protein LOC143897547 isoform X4 [Temnothorax americanus]|uniref:uncharacterized protein LOC143897547 isoform X4 n=1 Tax=Temnothorax americanus TaxID=1964332 RepID=UPI0040698275
MLRPGGIFLMLWVSSHDTFKILENMAENKCFASYLYKYGVPFPHSEKPQMELKELLRSIGFRIRHCSNRETNFVDKKPKAFLPTIISAFSFLREMPPDRAENFKNEFVREYTKRKYTRDNGGAGGGPVQNTGYLSYRDLIIEAISVVIKYIYLSSHDGLQIRDKRKLECY